MMWHIMICTHCISRELYLRTLSRSSLYSKRGYVDGSESLLERRTSFYLKFSLFHKTRMHYSLPLRSKLISIYVIFS
jgi:hypothetical protein